MPEPTTDAAPLDLSTLPYKVKIIRSDLPKKLQEAAIKKVVSCISEKMIEKESANALKSYFDKEIDSPSWAAIIGKNFGSSVNHEAKYLMFFSIDVYHVLLFKSSSS